MERFARTEMVIGAANLARLRKSSVAVFGIGGVGGYAAEALARSGIGSLHLIDHDIVSLSNLNRQIIALESTLGRPKVAVMAERIKDINPNCEVYCYEEFYSPESGAHLLALPVDYVADCIDSVAAKAALIANCQKMGLPIIVSLGMGNKLDPTQLVVAELFSTHTCPLARRLRAALRKMGITAGVPAVFSKERPVKTGQGPTPGSTSFVPAAAGLITASVIVRALLEEDGA
ncbi:MAG TPA: tRNA threonylcarbamoyladenosine dehydratase [Firmicutes bacterium]|nr:tRNA threonylcarbamoyladenosine dehydratase [Bacillota bacterium]